MVPRRAVLPGAQAVDFTDKIQSEKSPEPPLAQPGFLEKAGRKWTGGSSPLLGTICSSDDVPETAEIRRFLCYNPLCSRIICANAQVPKTDER
jgi:hypothetical protein